MSEQSQLVLKGASGREYAFYVFDGGTQFKPAGGVYVLTRATADPTGGNTHSVIYVGQTGDLSERFDNHHKADACRRSGANRLCAIVQADEATRLAIERDLIAGYNPPCNG
jgi:hypothetical protein